MATSKKVINHYEEMKKELEELHLADLSKTDIGNVISEFKCEINSVRVSSRVKDLRGVISILEARGSLLPEDPWALEKISGIVNRPFATKRISNYKHYIEAEALLNKIPNQEPAKKRDCRLQLTERVFEEASRHLVNDWRMFARSLELEENEIQLIENNNCDKQNAAKQVYIFYYLCKYMPEAF